MPVLNRRSFLQSCAAGAFAMSIPTFSRAITPASPRRFNLCISIEAIEKEPERIERFAAAGGHTIWLPGFFYGYWPVPLEKIMEWRKRVEKAGLECQMINISLGHPGDALGSSDSSFPTSPPKRWKLAQSVDGSLHSGTSHHPPATEENVDALRRIAATGVKRLFLDDDFRLAQGPGIIGGCFCEAHKKAFLEKGGWPESDWDILLDDVKHRRLTPRLRQWVESTCDELSACFKAQQDAAPDLELGNMVMYFGAEKAGIRLDDYRNALFRVGEMMFHDSGFQPVKGKTDELYSALFHRRFAAVDKAYSETTAFPADKLSAANMAAKLVISTITDVRQTMYMSGMTPFPMAHWDVLAPAMKEQAAMHAVIAGHSLQGPMKHYWGEGSRYVGDDKPFSLFLALGIPFEVIDTLPKDGWTFLADADAQYAGIEKAPAEARFIVRPDAGIPASDRIQPMEETWEALCTFKKEILPQLGDIPHIVDEKPALFAWYPTARAALVWNLSESPEALTVRIGKGERSLSLPPLAAQLLEDLPV